MSHYENWRLLVGDQEERNWSDNEYIFRIGKEEREADPILRELQSKTPLTDLINKTVGDSIIRSITYLSYYLINPTFKHDGGDDIGSNFFWFPLDKLTAQRYEELLGDIGEQGDEMENNEGGDGSSDDAALPDFPIMSTIGEPVIEAATSDEYISQVTRSELTERQSVLQEEIRRRQRELVEEIEAWLEEGVQEKTFKENFSEFAEAMGRMPARFLLGGIKNERERIEEIHEIFTNMDPSSKLDELGPELLLGKLTNLTEHHPVLINPAIEGFCLDQHDRGCEFHITKHRGYELEDSLDQCEWCGSDLYRVFRAGLDDTVRDAWMMGLLPELVTARILESCDWTEEVIPNRKVQMKNDDGLTPSVEVDIVVHTNDDEVFFFEVTSQRDALNRLNSKKEKFNSNNIEFDGLVQLSLTENPEFINFGDNTVAGGAWMIPKLERPEFYENLSKELG